MSSKWKQRTYVLLCIVNIIKHSILYVGHFKRIELVVGTYRKNKENLICVGEPDCQIGWVSYQLSFCRYERPDWATQVKDPGQGVDNPYKSGHFISDQNCDGLGMVL